MWPPDKYFCVISSLRSLIQTTAEFPMAVKSNLCTVGFWETANTAVVVRKILQNPITKTLVTMALRHPTAKCTSQQKEWSPMYSNKSMENRKQVLSVNVCKDCLTLPPASCIIALVSCLLTVIDRIDHKYLHKRDRAWPIRTVVYKFYHKTKNVLFSLKLLQCFYSIRYFKYFNSSH